ncbi:hypothetical protein V8E55_001250, partial [Tylopilus felleus]
WKVECGHASLAVFASSNPSPDELPQISDQIILNHTMAPCEPTWTSKQAPKKKTADDSDSTSDTDNAHHNICLLTHDLLYVLELVHATSAGDFGWIEDILGNLAMIFHGASSNNYCSEILHFLYNLKKVWTPEDIMCDNMLVNLTGIEGHCMPINLNIEHLIRFLKVRLSHGFVQGLTCISSFSLLQRESTPPG